MSKKQSDLPGVEGPGVSQISIPEIDTAIENYVTKRDTRMLMTLKEIEAKKILSDLMHAHEKEIGMDSDGTLVYHYDTEVCTLKLGKEELKVKTTSEVT